MTSAYSIVARKEIVDHFRDRRSLTSAAAHALMGPAIVMLVSFSPKGQGQAMPDIMLGMMSVFALVSAFVGAMNIAIDVMSGERERRSLVPLLMTPVPPRDVVIGKWMAVSLFGLGALTFNVAGLVIVLAWRAPATLVAHAALLASWAILGLAPLVLLGASLEIFVAGLSRTMKEAGTSLTLVLFAPMIVGMFLVFFPVPDGWWSVVPMVGQQVVLDAGLRGAPAVSLHVVVLGLVTAVCAWGPLMAAARVLGRDDVAAWPTV
jgi:sodium transport system permease protein